ncbi:MAG: hypothetical protein BAA03_05890 [Caldibacillus debilis]|nr:MAG: hypothetical protein BAA03_05890 [Caldibacillus debilis]
MRMKASGSIAGGGSGPICPCREQEASAGPIILAKRGQSWYGEEQEHGILTNQGFKLPEDKKMTG